MCLVFGLLLLYFETVHGEIGVFVPSNFHSLATKTKLQLIVRNFDNSTYITWKILHKIRNKGIKPTRFAKKAIKMTIGKHGIPNIKKRSSTSKKKYGKFMKKLVKFVKKFKKVIKKMKRILKKIVKLRKINKVLKKINKYGVKSLNAMEKYK